MTIRKTGSVTGEVTGIEDDGQISKTGSSEPFQDVRDAWGGTEEDALAAENRKADQGDLDQG